MGFLNVSIILISIFHLFYFIGIFLNIGLSFKIKIILFFNIIDKTCLERVHRGMIAKN